MGTRDLLSHNEYSFNAERMLRNCSRLRIGAIGKSIAFQARQQAAPYAQAQPVRQVSATSQLPCVGEEDIHTQRDTWGWGAVGS